MTSGDLEMRRNKKDIAKTAARRESYRYRCTCSYCMSRRGYNAKAIAKAKEEEIINYYLDTEKT